MHEFLPEKTCFPEPDSLLLICGAEDSTNWLISLFDLAHLAENASPHPFRRFALRGLVKIPRFTCPLELCRVISAPSAAVPSLQKKSNYYY
jgi:hypothetical protein